MLANPKVTAFHGVRLTFETVLPFDEVLSRFHAQVGVAAAAEIVRLARETSDENTFANLVEARFVGKSGFTLFSEIDHGGWIQRFGIQRRVLRLIFGNPLIAITMLCEDLSAALFVPVELLLMDESNGGASLAYVQPSSLIVINQNDRRLCAAARALDKKVFALIAAILED